MIVVRGDTVRGAAHPPAPGPAALAAGRDHLACLCSSGPWPGERRPGALSRHRRRPVRDRPRRPGERLLRGGLPPGRPTGPRAHGLRRGIPRAEVLTRDRAGGGRTASRGPISWRSRSRRALPAGRIRVGNVRYTEELHTAGLVRAARRLRVQRAGGHRPPGQPAGIDRRGRPRPAGRRLVVGDPTVPVGAYARTALERLGLEGALGNVVSEEPDVRGVVAKSRSARPTRHRLPTDVLGERGACGSSPSPGALSPPWRTPSRSPHRPGIRPRRARSCAASSVPPGGAG